MSISLQPAHVAVASLKESVPRPNPVERLNGTSDRMTWISWLIKQIAEKLKGISESGSI
ncbi:MAG: hypothetical protein OEV45_15620 [Desulfobacteraceae bacterium]|nr:hypothetical protein [Desulfobacteraceae bacterium]